MQTLIQSLIWSESIEILKSMKYYRELKETKNSVNHCSEGRWGHHTSDNNAFTQRDGKADLCKQAVPWVAKICNVGD